MTDYCNQCDKVRRLRKDGTFQRHNYSKGIGAICPGSGQKAARRSLRENPPVQWTPMIVVVWSDKVETWHTNDDYADAIADVINTDLGPSTKTRRPKAAIL